MYSLYKMSVELEKRKSRSKQPEYVREYFYKYYNENKERFWSSIVHCDCCDKDIKKSSYLRHLRTKKHNIKALKETTLTISADSEDAS